MAEKSTLNIKFNDLWQAEPLKELLNTSLPVDSIQEVLKAFYWTKLGQHVNSGDYDRIRELDGILELYNMLEGNKDEI